MSLANEIEQWVQKKVDTGLYASASEVVWEALGGLFTLRRRAII